jgi:hypothetical protein
MVGRECRCDLKPIAGIRARQIADPDPDRIALNVSSSATGVITFCALLLVIGNPVIGDGAEVPGWILTRCRVEG